ncbi:hypothetical protein PVL30_005613 [Lodderomyces elongisporus]|nr:uncharacterized protein PVL30_005613 [Lodderomyces elongisporus]WLF81812.1 hypothetical protein PVL30_005613 [Lodderomyces elongisporus]
MDGFHKFLASRGIQQVLVPSRPSSANNHANTSSQLAESGQPQQQRSIQDQEQQASSTSARRHYSNSDSDDDFGLFQESNQGEYDRFGNWDDDEVFTRPRITMSEYLLSSIRNDNEVQAESQIEYSGDNEHVRGELSEENETDAQLDEEAYAIDAMAERDHRLANSSVVANVDNNIRRVNIVERETDQDEERAYNIYAAESLDEEIGNILPGRLRNVVRNDSNNNIDFNEVFSESVIEGDDEIDGSGDNNNNNNTNDGDGDIDSNHEDDSSESLGRGIALDYSNEFDDPDRFYDSRRESFSYRNEFVTDHHDPMNFPPQSQSQGSSIGTTFTKNLKKEYKYDYIESRAKLDLSKLKVLNLNNFTFLPPEDKFSNSGYEDIVSYNPTRLLQKPPAEKFHNGLKLNSIGTKRVEGFEHSKKYKNNLTCIMNFHEARDYMVIAANSELLFYKFDAIENLPEAEPCFRFETRPVFTSSTDRLISTWPYFPHTINYITTALFNGEDVLAVCVDDGSLLIWKSQTIANEIDKFQNKKRHGNLPLRIKPDFKIKLSASIWGLDFSDNIIAASDNSQCIVLLYYHTPDNRFYHVTSHQVLHNIPSVSILKHTDDEVLVACASISGEMVIFKFNYAIVSGPLGENDLMGKVYYTDQLVETMERRDAELPREQRTSSTTSSHCSLKRINFADPIVISRCVMDEDCWTVQLFKSQWFLPVGSLKNVFGDSDINEEQEMERIIKEKALLGGGSALGDFQFFKPKTVQLSHDDDIRRRTTTMTRPFNTKDVYRRVFKQVQHHYHQNDEPNFLMVTTAKKMALLQIPSLYCSSSTDELFNMDLPYNEDSKHSNRMSIAATIPELSCFIGVSQQGLVSIMRLCCYNGVHGMRQEHVFPNALNLAIGHHGYRTIIGLCVKGQRQSEGEDFTLPVSYLIYVTYNDGTILGYKLHE